MKKNKILVIIPARGGSKGIIKKNIVDLSGKPLIQYTIEPALRLKKEKIVDEAIISTDCEEIAKVSLDLGMKVPFVRPKELARDKSKSIDFVLHALSYYENINIFFETAMILQPTSPLRSYEDIINSIELFEKESGDSLITAYSENQLSDLIIYRKKDSFAEPINKNHNEGVRRQNFDKIYIRNGAIYMTSVNYLRKNKKIISNRPLLYEMPKDRSVNIDSHEDLEVAKCLLKRLV